MKVKVKKEFELHSNHTAHKDDILNLITIHCDIDCMYIILEKHSHIFKVCFVDEFDANEHLEFDYQEIKSSVNYTWIREDEVEKMLSEAEKRKQEEVDFWKNKFMKLIDKF